MLKTTQTLAAAGEGKTGSERGFLEEEGGLDPVNANDKMDLIQELIAMVDSVHSIGEFRKTQKKEACVLMRRLKLLLPLLEEIRDGEPVPEAAMVCLSNLKKAFVAARKLLKMCTEGSKIFLAFESEEVMVRFRSVYEKLSQAFDGMPYNEIGISEEVKEQVELMRLQLKRAKKRSDTQDMELAMDMMVILSTKEDINGDRASIERLANSLGLHTIGDLRVETQAVRELTRERPQNTESNRQLIDLLSKFKRIAGLEDNDVLDDPAEPKTLAKSPSLAIPNDFLCPITLEIMTDPVIIATGQTYERESIQKWLDSDHRTCPKTGQVLSHLSLAPNFALRNLILQWCEKNNFQLPKKEAPTSSSVECNEEISSLVQNLSSSHLGEQRKAVRKIRTLTKDRPESRVSIANSGAIPPLVCLLSYPDSKIQEDAVTALLNLSIDETNKKLITQEEPIPAIVEVLQRGTVGGKENSAAALFSLSMLDENKAKIGLLNGIPPLVDLLQTGTIRGKKDAVTALFNLCLCNANKDRAVEAGIIASAIELLKNRTLDMVDQSLSLLLLLASHPVGRKALEQLSVVQILVSFIKEGTPKNRECATAVLLELCLKNSNIILAALQEGVYEDMVELCKNGTNRGQRKASALLQLMTKSEQIPW
ncbi:U-box domain-containing protein 15 [Diospyros lotus]|uniref:U-box domain-containing protein 15 n=1 Tax=Diospyros lotus TaxID=55363 RepID=UPI00224D24B4|nr:U-box domain-containing protein 15 [Diospyros lotus]